MLMNVRRFNKKILLLTLALVVSVVYFVAIPFSTDDSFLDFDLLSKSHRNINVTGLRRLIVPNIIHLIQFDNPFISFVTYLCIKAAIKHQSPDVVIIHTNQRRLSGKYWGYLQGERVRIELMEKPEKVFGLPLAQVYHSSDVARLIILIKFGGIYIDNDLLILRSLDSFRRFECTIGWPENEFIGNQLIIAHKNSRFIAKWYQSYRLYNGSSWYFNAGELPTKVILSSHPEYVHRETDSFGVAPQIFYLYLSSKEKTDWTNKFHAIHLLERHRSYLVPGDPIKYFNEFNIRSYNSTFGSMARDVLFNSTVLMT